MNPTTFSCRRPGPMPPAAFSTLLGSALCSPASAGESCIRGSIGFPRSPCRSCWRSVASRSAAKRGKTYCGRRRTTSSAKLWATMDQRLSIERGMRPAAGPTLVPVLGVVFEAAPEGALWWQDESLLIVADLHFEKGSSFARRGMFLPPYDTGATLAALEALIRRLEPKRIVALGDSFHDG